MTTKRKSKKKASKKKASKKKATKKKTTKKKATKKKASRRKHEVKISLSCAAPSPYTRSQRAALPAQAFGLPRTREYPMYKLGRDGKLVPSSSHARSAMAYAAKYLVEGKLSQAKFDRINRKANAVIALCAKGSKKSPSSSKATKGRVFDKQTDDAVRAFYASSRRGR